MNVKFKKVLLGMAMMLGLTLLPISTQTVFAGNEAGSGTSSGSWLPIIHSGEGEVGGNQHGGPSQAKSGFYVTCSIASDPQGSPTPVGHGAILRSQDAARNNYNVPAFDVESQSKIAGTHRGYYGTAPWPYPAYGTGAGFGKLVINWCNESNAEGTSDNGITLLNDCCGVTPEQIKQYIADGKSVFLNIEPIAWTNHFDSMAASSMTTSVDVGLVEGIARAYSSKTWVWRYLNNIFPRSFMYDATYQGIAAQADPGQNVFIATSELTNHHGGYGIGSLLINDSYQVVICIEDSDGAWQTQYIGWSKPEYTIQNPYNDCEFVEATFSTKKSTLTSVDASYDAVCSSGAPNRGTGAGGVTFDVPANEVALFIHYKGDFPPPDPSEAHLYSWETDYIFPNYLNDRAGGYVNNEYTLKEYIEECIEEVEGYTQACPHNSSYSHATATGSAVIDKITCRGSEDWESQHYGISANLGKFPNASWNLYRESVSGELWDTYSEALNNTDKWTIDEPVDPQFSYVLSRSHLEDLSACPEGGDLAAALNIAPNYEWETDWVGKTGASQKADSENSIESDVYEWTMTAYGFDLIITYHFEHDAVHWEDGEYGDWDNDPDTPDTYEVTDSEDHPAHEFSKYKYFKSNSYTPPQWDENSTGGSHIIDKYKCKVTPSGQNTAAGTVVAWEDGSNLSGNFAKGGSFDYTAKTGQLVGSQFQGVSFSIYPEVKMSVWTSTGGADKYASPQESVCYVMGEYARHYTPPIAHSYKARLTTGSMEGMGTLASAADGSDAKKVLDNASGHQDNDLGVTAMGTTFEIATTSRYKIDIYTVGCNVTDHEANSEWGNEKQSVKGSHEEYVSSILAGMQQEIMMRQTVLEPCKLVSCQLKY